MKECESWWCTDSQQISIVLLSYVHLKKLRSCSTYEIKVYETSRNLNEPSFTEMIRSNEIFQKLEIQVEQEEGDSTSLRVFWSSEDYLRCPKNFQVEAHGPDNSIIRSLQTGNKLHETIKDLEPCETYLITVTPMKGEDPLVIFGGSINYTMNSVIPSKIRDLNLLYVEEEESIDISWLAPELGSKCVKDYSIQAESLHDNRTAKYELTANLFPNVKISNVFACTEYSIQVDTNTIHEKKGEEFSERILIPSRGKTLDIQVIEQLSRYFQIYAVFKAPAPPNVLDFTSKKVTLSTSVNNTDQKNYCQINRVEFKCVDPLGNAFTRSEESTSFELSGLKPYTYYKCYVRIKNEADHGEVSDYSPESHEKEFRTQESSKNDCIILILMSI